jgi:uncharacterized protein (TIGR04255 family)
MPISTFNINLDESFQHLARAPIVEAEIRWVARARNPLAEDTLTNLLAQRLPEYSRKSLHKLSGISRTQMPDESVRINRKLGWAGVRLTSTDNRYAAVFKRNVLVFSRVNGYDSWGEFISEGQNVWNVYRDIADPVELRQLLVRYINHFPTATPQNIGEILRDPPTCPADLPLKDFVYQSTFEVPAHPFGVRVNKVIQPDFRSPQPSSGLFLDIEVFSTQPISCEAEPVHEALRNIRWLKNTVFFSILTSTAINSFS